MTCGVDFVTELAVSDHIKSHLARNTMACNIQLHKRSNNVTTRTWNFQVIKDFAVNKNSDWQLLVIWLLYNQDVNYRNRLKKKFELVNKKNTGW